MLGLAGYYGCNCTDGCRRCLFRRLFLPVFLRNRTGVYFGKTEENEVFQSWNHVIISSTSFGHLHVYRCRLHKVMKYRTKPTRMNIAGYKNPNHGAEPGARANDPICHVLCSEPHRPRQLGSRLIFNVRQIGKRTRHAKYNPDI